MGRNELDELLGAIVAECTRRKIPVFRSASVWDDENLTNVHWQSEESPGSWRAFLDVAAARGIPMLIVTSHAFPESSFEIPPPPPGLRLDPAQLEGFEAHRHMLAAAGGFARQTGRIEAGWIEGRVYYFWEWEADWYGRVWDLVMSNPLDREGGGYTD